MLLEEKFYINYSAGYPGGYRISGNKLAGHYAAGCPANLVSGATLAFSVVKSHQLRMGRILGFLYPAE